jgi:hypothetical protein
MALAKFSEWVEFYENENAGGAVNMPSPTGAFTTGVEEPEESDEEFDKQVGAFTAQFSNFMNRIAKPNRINKPTVRKMIHDIIKLLMTKANLTGAEMLLLQKTVTQTGKQM